MSSSEELPLRMAAKMKLHDQQHTESTTRSTVQVKATVDGMADFPKGTVPAKRLNTDYPVIDTDPYIGRAFSYARPSDWLQGTAVAAMGPGFLLLTERFAPSFAGKGAFPPVLRLSALVGATAGIYHVYQNSCLRFYGFKENGREVEMDMREMVEKVKKGQPLYGESEMTPYMQGVAARNSRYSALMLHVVPMANFANHSQHGVDTAKYYQQAERELEASKGTS